MTAPAKKRGPVVAVDGPSGVGKSTVSRLLAARLGFMYVNTGTMYRSVALAAEEAGVDLHSEEAMERFCSTLKAGYDREKGAIVLNGSDYSGSVATQHAAAIASVVSSKRPVREFLVSFQRELGCEGRVVMEGRDIGTVVFPDADAKFFLDAPHEVRAARRSLEVSANEGSVNKDVSREIRERDARDATRAVSPLVKAADAVEIDTSTLDANGVADAMAGVLKERGIS